jgi:hypothetical protein
MPARHRRERLVRALHDALAADVDPAARGHLAVHREAAVLEVAEGLPRRPRGHEQTVRDQHARRARMCLKDTDRLSRLDQQRFVVLERSEGSHDGVKRLPVPRRLAGAAVDNEIVGPFGNVGIQIVHEHAQRGFLRPAFAGQRRASRRFDGASCGGH